MYLRQCFGGMDFARPHLPTERSKRRTELVTTAIRSRPYHGGSNASRKSVAAET
jgi:hypothetical protein